MGASAKPKSEIPCRAPSPGRPAPGVTMATVDIVTMATTDIVTMATVEGNHSDHGAQPPNAETVVVDVVVVEGNHGDRGSHGNRG